MQHQVVEMVLFSVRKGVTRNAFLATVDGVSQWAQAQPGFISRDLSWSESDDRWMDLIWWQTLADALAAADAIMASEECGAMMSLIDETSMVMVHAAPAIPRVSA
jgi:hypothetical protein